MTCTTLLLHAPLLACRKSPEEAASNNDEASPPPPADQPATEKEVDHVSERQGDDISGAKVARGTTQESQCDGGAQLGSAASAADESSTTAPAAAAADAKVPGMEETKGASPDGDGQALTGSSAGKKPDDGGGEGEAEGGASDLVETGAAESKQDNAGEPDDAQKRPENLGKQQQTPPPEKKLQPAGRAQEPQGDIVNVAGEPTATQAEGQRAVRQIDSSDDEDEDDGFKVVVGREVAPAAVTPVVPTKRFLRGEDALCDTKQFSVVLNDKG